MSTGGGHAGGGCGLTDPPLTLLEASSPLTTLEMDLQEGSPVRQLWKTQVPVGEGPRSQRSGGAPLPAGGLSRERDFLFLACPWWHRAWNAALELARRPGRAGCRMDFGGRGAGTLNLRFAQSWPWEVTGGSLVSWRGQKGDFRGAGRALLRVLPCSTGEPCSARARMLREGVSGEGRGGI